jgi:cell wall-associated NlpC family hydrolase
VNAPVCAPFSDAVEAEARTWLGTPFAPGAAVKGAGCDCAGLAGALATFCGIAVPARVGLTLGQALTLSLAPRVGAPQPGDIVLLAREPGGTGEHAALLTGSGTLIHAHWSQGVVENRYGRWFAERTIAAFMLAPPPKT